MAPCGACYCCPVSPQWFLPVSLPPAEAPPSGMSKNGYFFQEMGESEPPPGHVHAPHITPSTLAGFCDTEEALIKDPWVWSSHRNRKNHLNAANNVQYKGCENKDWSCRTHTENSHTPLRLDRNNELFSGCYDNGSFITFKPRRGTQLVCAAQAVGTEYACIGSPCLPRPIIPLLQHADSLSRFTEGPPPPAADGHDRLYWETFYQDINAITLLLTSKHYPPLSSQGLVSEGRSGSRECSSSRLTWKILVGL